MAHVSGLHDPRRVAVVCHRGGSNLAPENTLASARVAVDAGADYVEVDVNQSADGVHYVFHGPRLEPTTNGAGLFHHHRAAEIDRLDAGAWFGAEFAGEPVPRLEAMLEFLRGKCRVFFDVKRADLPLLVEQVRRFDLAQNSFFWFGDPDQARAFHSLAPDLVQKVNVRNAADVRAAHASLNAGIVEVQPRCLSKGVVRVCQELSIRLMVNYMGRDSAVFRELARWPVDMINLDHLDCWQSALEDAAATAPITDIPVAGPATRRVVLFLLDGCRPDAIHMAPTPNIDRLVARGSATWRARSVMPSITLPCHTSIFYSLSPDRHGVRQNVWQRPPAPACSLAQALRDAGQELAMFYTWEELRDLAPPGTVTMAFQRRLSREGLVEVGRSAAAAIAQLKPAMSFVYLEATDAAGHQYGWMSPEYLEAVTFSDGLIGDVLAALERGGDLDETVVVVMADHGGHGFGHGTDGDEDMLAPFVAVGPGIAAGKTIDEPLSLIDVAPTLFRLLGLEAPAAWEGRALDLG